MKKSAYLLLGFSLFLLLIGCKKKAPVVPIEYPLAEAAYPPSKYNCTEIITIQEALIDCGSSFETPPYNQISLTKDGEGYTTCSYLYAPTIGEQKVEQYPFLTLRNLKTFDQTDPAYESTRQISGDDYRAFRFQKRQASSESDASLLVPGQVVEYKDEVWEFSSGFALERFCGDSAMDELALKLMSKIR